MKYHPLIFVYIIGCFAHYSIGSILFQRQNVSSISITDSVTSNDTDISFNTETTTVTLETTALPAKQPLTGTPRTIPVTSASATVTAEESRSENLILHRIPTQLEEKLAALSCDLPLLPSESRLWNGNETHELLLPITVCYFVFFLHPSPYLKPTSLPSTSTLNISSSNIEIRGENADPFSSVLKEFYGYLSRLWNGNETHELLLPITIYPDCTNSKEPVESPSTISETPTECPPPIVRWEGEVEIQSGDILLVRIDDAQLIHQPTVSNESDIDQNTERSLHESTTAVYQVTRTGHDNCDITEGVLLDINPLKVDNRKVVTLYDKDLTEGINLLIVVSELWKNQCIRLKVVVKSDNCGENEDCSGKGLCYSNISMEGYECQCCPGFVGPHCEEQDACYPSPCENNGICVDISQGHEGSTFQCLCPYGYTGKTCSEETDPCTSMPCQNGASCTGNVTQFKCDCPHGFSGQLCQHNLNECDSSPCIHGICVDQEDGYKCFCQPGFTGTHCQYEYNECESSPCLNGGTCTDRIGSYSCTCGRGFTGKRCHIKVDLCEPNPCTEPRYCLDRGNNYSCECPKGYSGVDCLTPLRAACSTNPCTNGGTCWSSIDSFYCACRPGYTGKTCEDEFVVETITNVDPINKENELGLQMPISIHLDHLHNVYIAAGTLACAFVIVALIVTVCHCRVNKTYKRFLWINYPFWGCKSRRAPEPSTSINSEWFTGKDKAPMATPSRNLPSLDTTDMYYTLDFSDSQNSPLIQ
ncbi:EGF-like domain [Popillia japonica]|uniref:EGF-like domain n=1 Tax=Popillia japonica TaxID=7064 RepID=A0AAW1NJ49_POPJA